MSEESANKLPDYSREPSIYKTSFHCPHCGTLATQFWFFSYADRVDRKENKPPHIGDSSDIKRFENLLKQATNPREETEIEPDQVRRFIDHVEQIMRGGPFLDSKFEIPRPEAKVENIHLSKCYDCKRIAIWVHTNLIYPAKLIGPEPNKDIPEEIKKYYNEARSISELSSSGAGALLRLTIEKLTQYILGVDYKDTLFDSIGELVKRGLDSRIQKALDAARVFSNDFVHTGGVNPDEDSKTVSRLFDLVNIIADEMISKELKIDAAWKDVPEKKKKGIEQRDNKK